MKHYIGVDGGGSKTAVLVIDENQHPLGRGLAGASNHLRVGIETATRNIERAVNIALVEAGIAIRNVVPSPSKVLIVSVGTAEDPV